MIHGFSAADIIAIIAALAAGITAVATALHVGGQVKGVAAAVTTPTGASIGTQVSDLTTVTALATKPTARTLAQDDHLAAVEAVPPPVTGP
jgi:ABC-type tungstate transport system substrate-binding protein